MKHLIIVAALLAGAGLISLLDEAVMAQGMDNATYTVGGIALTDTEVQALTKAKSDQADELRDTRRFVEQVVKWIDETAPGVIQDSGATANQKQALRDRAVQMRADFIALGKAAIEQAQTRQPSAADVRGDTLKAALERAESRLQHAETSVATLPAEAPKEDKDAATLAVTDAKAARDAAAVELSEFNLVQP